MILFNYLLKMWPLNDFQIIRYSTVCFLKFCLRALIPSTCQNELRLFLNQLTCFSNIFDRNIAVPNIFIYCVELHNVP